MKAERAIPIALGLVAFTAMALAVWLAPAAPAPETEPARAPLSDAGPEPTTFIAMMADFAGFASWDRYPVAGAMLPVGIEDGPTFIYANRRPDPDRPRWPVGTILVKVIESGSRPEDWTIHAMVKRGVPYNGDGAVGWEFFELTLSRGPGAPPLILWRGPGPPSGHGYAAQDRDAGPEGIPLVCNDCHAAAWRNDAVLTDALAVR